VSSVTLLDKIPEVLDYTGIPVRADGWYGYPDGLHTVAIYLQNFVGSVIIEASLVIHPTEHDWFAVQLIPGQSCLNFPQNPLNPTGINGGDAGVVGYSFKANILWIRARVIRSYIYDPTMTPDRVGLLGSVRKIFLSL
jgi:hypothetical protein